ncbi:hypothetical protein LMG10661_02330 [Ralstonia syzygii subsp. syzygii]|nr:hypothetical protein LMG10661_02330 [Ralstonia syzygii subsp. syzygii]
MIESDAHYRKGAKAARRLLLHKQRALEAGRKFRPNVVRKRLEAPVQAHSDEYKAGFADGLGAYVLTTLEGVSVDLERWEILRELAFPGEAE